jgi:hypothetical protein
MKTDGEFLEELTAEIRWPHFTVEGDYDKFRNRLMRLLYARREEEKERRLQDKAANEVWLELNKRNLERTVREQEENIMWEEHDGNP